MKASYKSLLHYDFDRILSQKRNLAQVQSVLTLYERNNKDLVYQVEDLIRQNIELKKKVSTTHAYIHDPQSPINLKKQFLSQNQPYQFYKSNKRMSKKQCILPNSKTNTQKNPKSNHPRNVYLTPEEIQKLNVKSYQQARTRQKAYDHSNQYQNFKEKLSQKKQQLKRSYRTKSNLESSGLSMSRNVYLQQSYQDEKFKKQPLQQASNYNKANIERAIEKNVIKEQLSQKRTNLENKQLLKQNVYVSPAKYKHQQFTMKSYSPRKSSSAIKIQQVYPENSVRIQEPKTKWKDLSSTYFEKKTQNDQIEIDINQQLYKTSTTLNQGKKGKKKFLKVISQHNI